MSERTHHRVGVPGRHMLTARELSEWAKGLADAHEPTADMPEATADIIDGLWFDFESTEAPPDTQA